MSKSVRIDDDLYEKIEEFALKEDRPVANALVRLIKLGLGLSEPPENKTVEIPNGVGSQANNQEPTAEHLVMQRSSGKSYSKLKAEKTKLIAEYQERINYCQDYDERDRLQHELDEKLEPIQFEIDEMFKK